MRSRLTIAIGISILCLFAANQEGARAAQGYQHLVVGNFDDVTRETRGLGNRQAAFDPFVLGRIRNAEALWIAGGDQSNYVRFWQDTPVEAEINALAARPAPIGGVERSISTSGEVPEESRTRSPRSPVC